jgi:AraC-like DNA-binding protein
VYLRHRVPGHAGRTVVADPTVAVVSRRGEAWRSSHPAGRGDRGIWVCLDADAEAVGAPAVPQPLAQRVHRLSPRAWLDWATVAHAGDPELALALVADLLAGPVDTPLRAPRWVHQARLILADAPGSAPDLTSLAAEVGVSPWHLCRTFRAVTGSTPRAYAERLRLAEAAERIAGGCDDLASLALSLGFSSHSHLSARFRAVFGRAPSALRHTARS